VINVGYVVGFHGLKGEIKIKSTSDFIDKRLSKGNKLLLVKDNDEQEVTIKSSRNHKNTYLVYLDGYNNLNEVEKFRGYSIKVNEDDLYPLEEDEYYHFELIGLKVYDYQNNLLGSISSILETGANDILVIKENNQEIMIPLIKSIVNEINISKGIITLFEIDGLF
jgi:16S rRNA processing protein RimM